MNYRAFSLSVFRYFRAFTHYGLFVSFRSLNFGCKINRINPLLVNISSKLPAITNHYECRRLFQTTIKNYKVPHLKSTDVNRIQAAPSLRFHSRGTRKHKGVAFFKQILDLCSNWGPNMKWGAHILNGERAPLSPRWRRPWIQVTTLTCCNIHGKQRYCTMLATATGNCAVTNVTYNENKYYVVTWTFYLESSMYLRRR